MSIFIIYQKLSLSSNYNLKTQIQILKCVGEYVPFQNHFNWCTGKKDTGYILLNNNQQCRKLPQNEKDKEDKPCP